jgi:hypothetical protein
VPVTRSVSLLDPGEVEERGRELVAGGPDAALDVRPRLGDERDVVAEADVARPDRVEHPPGAALDPVGD